MGQGPNTGLQRPRRPKSPRPRRVTVSSSFESKPLEPLPSNRRWHGKLNGRPGESEIAPRVSATFAGQPLSGPRVSRSVCANTCHDKHLAQCWQAGRGSTISFSLPGFPGTCGFEIGSGVKAAPSMVPGRGPGTDFGRLCPWPAAAFGQQGGGRDSRLEDRFFLVPSSASGGRSWASGPSKSDPE